MMQPCPKTQRGVTWWELLLVIVILAVLALIFFPVFQKAREREGPVTQSCASREKQLGLAFFQYAQDNDQYLPPGLTPAGSRSPSGIGWAGQVYPYVKQTLLFQCPDEDTDDNPWNKPPHCHVSYGYNVNLAGGREGNYSGSPAHTVLLFEVSDDTANMTLPGEGALTGATVFSAAGDGTDGSLRSAPGRISGQARYATGVLGGRPSAASSSQFAGSVGRHQGSANYVFADGHVKFLKPDQVSSGTDAPTPTAAQTGGVTGTAAGTANGKYTAMFSVR
ncbi:MAG: DUF1559 domain-containing protein [Armatimonadetes bacterium]|nr:DUF1559 domain-containing protein [Armatimonadota bacterium]